MKSARAEADRLAAEAGFTPLTGTAVRVALDDAPLPKSDDLPHGVHPDDLVVHQADVQAVVNALWAGGARGMQIMDQRVISTSAVRCVGNTLILQGVVYSPPFRITAVADPDRLRAALGASPRSPSTASTSARTGSATRCERWDGPRCRPTPATWR